MRKGSGTFFIYKKFWEGTTRNSGQERVKAGYHHEGGALPFALHPLYCAFRVNRCVRAYIVGTHVRSKKEKFLHIGVFFRLTVWYTQLNKSAFIKENIDETIFMFALFKCRKSDKRRN